MPYLIQLSRISIAIFPPNGTGRHKRDSDDVLIRYIESDKISLICLL